MDEGISQDIMTTYELISLIIAGAAMLLSIIIPAVQTAFRHFRKAKLRIIPFDANPLIVFFNESGSYIEMKFSIACTRNNCIVKTITASILHIETQSWINRRWTFLKPINVNWVNAGFQKAQLNGATFVHPLRLAKDSLEPLFVEFGTDLEAADDVLIQDRNKALAQIADRLKGETMSFDDPKSKETITRLANRFSDRLYWEVGLYELTLTIDYDASKSISAVFHFELNEKDIQRLRANALPIVFYTAPFPITNAENLVCNTVTPKLR